ncbi:hypothetical protein SETIT_3G277400v2 [Setaria italica]|uniref:Uncharacterized protein n=1 Tax=Setaria italica TaxID=4555 RepID=A0A368QJN4_SETIT|nr:hypothetical protein SETIT_3G277400v2 [Setaria italica]
MPTRQRTARLPGVPAPSVTTAAAPSTIPVSFPTLNIAIVRQQLAELQIHATATPKKRSGASNADEALRLIRHTTGNLQGAPLDSGERRVPKGHEQDCKSTL